MSVRQHNNTRTHPAPTGRASKHASWLAGKLAVADRVTPKAGPARHGLQAHCAWTAACRGRGYSTVHRQIL